MPTVREYFFAEARTLTSHADHGIAVDGETVIVTARAHYDLDAGVQYASYLVPASDRTIPALKLLLKDPGFANRMAAAEASVTTSHPTLREHERSAADLPFTRRIYLYTEARLSDDELADLQRMAAEGEVMLDVRDAVYADERTRLEIPRGFISHDSRDKVEVARPLAEKLRQMLCPVWYDEFSLAVGDSLRASIDKGLHESPKCVLICRVTSSATRDGLPANSMPLSGSTSERAAACCFRSGTK